MTEIFLDSFLFSLALTSRRQYMWRQAKVLLITLVDIFGNSDISFAKRLAKK